MEYGPLIIRNTSTGGSGYLTFLFYEGDIKQTSTAHKVHTCAGNSQLVMRCTTLHSSLASLLGGGAATKHIYLIKSKLAVLEP